MVTKLVEHVDAIAEKVTNVYVERQWLQALIVSIPTFGGALDLLLSVKGREIVKKRFERFFHELKEEAKKIAEDKVDKDYLNSEEFYDLVREAMEAAAKSREQEKLQLIARALCKSEGNDEGYLNLSNEIIKLLVDLSLSDLHVVFKIYEHQKNFCEQDVNKSIEDHRRMLDKRQALIIQESCIPEEDIYYIFKKLESCGLIKPFLRTGMTNWGNPPYEITDFLRKIMKTLQD
ncbi:MAG: hypothetical protein K9K69_18010 [Desulfarculaceae bacterium]|nr:hypothetical protein [Desulfarculaceae bacterium]